MNVLILFTNNALALNILRCLAPLGVKCYLFGEGNTSPVSLSKFCKQCIPFKFTRDEKPAQEDIDAINKYCVDKKISCIFPADCETAIFLARIKHRLAPGVKTIPLMDAPTLVALDDKWEFEQILRKFNLPGPRTFKAENLEELKAIDLPFPRVVKPIRGGSRWLTGGDVGEYIKKDMPAYLAGGQDPRVYPLLVQEFISGYDVDLSILAFKGKIVAYTIQKWAGGDRIEFLNLPQLFELGRRFSADLKFEGIAHFDLRYDNRDGLIKFIECNPRFWGTLRASMWEGVNFPELALDLAMGKPAKEQNVPRQITYVLPAKILARLFKGDLSALKGLPDSSKNDLWQLLGDPLSCIYSVLHR